MSLLTILVVALGLAMDATAVALASSVALGRVTPRQVFRFAFHFGLFQAGMPVIGWLAGRELYEQIAPWDHWIAFVLLVLIGVKALRDAWKAEPDAVSADPTRGFSLIALSVATSIDALAVGLSLAALGVGIWYPCAVIGVVTAALTTAAMLVGSRVGERAGRGLRGLGGVVLVAIGVQILVGHLSG